MWGKTFETIFKKPIILIGFLFIVGLPMLATVPYINFYMENIEALTTIDQLSASESLGLLSTMLGYNMWIAIIGIFIIIFIAPPLAGYVNDAITGKPTHGWYLWGLKTNWWKIFVTSIIYFVIIGAILYALSLLLIVPLVGILAGILSILLSYASGIYYIIALTSVIYETSYRAGLANIITLGRRYFWKLLGTLLLFGLPVMFLTAGYGVYTAVETFGKLNSFDDITVAMQSYTPTANGVMIGMGIILAVYSIFYSAFIYTYSMHCYNDTRSKFFHKQFHDVKYQKVTNRK